MRRKIFGKQIVIDPLTLGQPKLWVTGDNFYLENSGGATPSIGDALYTLKRYNDNGLNATNDSTSNLPTYQEYNTATAYKGMIYYDDSATSNGRYTVGTKADFNFIHSDVSTHYFVAENIPTVKAGRYIFNTMQGTGHLGFQFLVWATGVIRHYYFRVYNSSQVFSYLSTSTWNRVLGPFNKHLISMRLDLNVAVGEVCFWFYVNGILEGTATKGINVSASNSTYVPRLFNRENNDGRYLGYVGDYIIYNTYHSDDEHTGVCNYLMNKWGIEP